MSIREVKAAGLDGLALATELLQRARRADPMAGLWEAADVQWWWAGSDRSDDIDRVFWIDDDGPVAGIVLTSFPGNSWQCDPVVVPGAEAPGADVVWERALDHAARYAPDGFDVPVEDDESGRETAERSGLTRGDGDFTAWMDAADLPAVVPPADGFVLVDRSRRRDGPHPLAGRNAPDVARRLDQCSLYDPTLDLAVETTDGRAACYAVFWFDPATAVGLVEPVRVEDEFQRRGLARAMLTAGIDRLVRSGATRIKVSYETDAAGAVYQNVGFRVASSTAWYRGSISM